MAFTNFTRQGHQTVSAEIQRELKDLGDRLGLKFDVGGGQIGATDLVIKVTASSNDASIVEDQKRRELEIYGRAYGLKGEDYGAEFTSQGHRYRLVGVKPSRPKFPISAERIRDGRCYKFTTSVVAKIEQGRAARSMTTPAMAQTSNSSSTPATDYSDAGMF